MRADALRDPGHPRRSYLDEDVSLRSWLLTTDHKRIGLLFLGALSGTLALGGIFALLMRLELLSPEPSLVEPQTYNRLFTWHGVIMVWLFLIPSIPTTLGNVLLPIMIGAREIAFPRLNLASFWVYVLGVAVTLVGMAAGGTDTGWTFYPPYSSRTPTSVVPILMGIFILGISSMLSGINFIVTTHTMRTEGMHWLRLPLFVWNVYATSWIMVLATPVLAMALILIAVDHGFGLGVFDPSQGGDPILYQHLFWFYSHPAVYIMILPGMGVVGEVVAAMAHKNWISYEALAFSAVGIAAVGFLTWGHHMFVSGMLALDVGIFGILSMLVAIFSAIKVIVWTGTLYRGSIALEVPLFYVFGFLFLFGFGGMTGVALASTSVDIHWHDTYFVVGHFHLIMVGGTLTAFLAGLYYWLPKLCGRMYARRAAFVAMLLVVFGFAFTFFPHLLLGNAGMPRRYAAYPEEFQVLHVISTLGSWMLTAGLVLAVLNLIHGWRRGEPADNPWDSRGIEWSTASPPPKHNFAGRLTVLDRPHQYWADEPPWRLE